MKRLELVVELGSLFVQPELCCGRREEQDGLTDGRTATD